MRGEADGSSAATDELLAKLSHELRAPLNAALLWVRLLRSGALDPATAQRALESIEENLRLQNQLISDLVDGRRAKPGPGGETTTRRPSTDATPEGSKGCSRHT